MITDKVIFRGLNSDDELSQMPVGDYRHASACRIGITDAGSDGALENIQGTLPTNVSFGSDNQHTVIGAFEAPDGSSIYFVHNNANNHRIIRYTPSLSSAGDNEILIKNPVGGDVLKFDITKKITGVDMVGNDLFWTDNKNGPRHINVARARRKDKPIEVEITFGKPEAGTNDVFANGDTYSFQAFESSGSSLVGPVVILTANGSYENDIIAGVKAFVAAFNANPSVNALYTAEACGRSVKLTEAGTGSASYSGASASVDITTTSGAPIAFYYTNVYPLDISEEIINLGKYPPSCEPSVTYKKDSTKEYNFVNESIFQFQYRYVYEGNFKSTWSPISKVAITPSACSNSAAFNYIEVDFSDVLLSSQPIANEIIRVEVGVREHNAGDLRLVRSIPRNEIGLHRAYIDFYNDGEYPVVDSVSATTLFNSVPRVCKSLTATLQNNNSDQRLILGGNKEGFDNVCVDSYLIPNFVAVSDCAGRYTLEFSIKITNFISATIGAIHHEETNIYPTFGGIRPGGSYVNGIETDYQQIIPEGGFIGYLAGTDHFGISIQDEDAAISAYTDSGKNIYDSSSTSKRNDIESAITTGSFRQRISIPNVKPGRYIVRLASHWCSYGDKAGKGTDYDLDNGRRYQTTSTYVYQVTPDGGSTVNGAEIIVDLPHIAAGTTQTVNAGEFTVGDMSDPSVGVASDVVQGYLFDAEGSSDLDKLLDGARMERRVVNFYDNSSSIGSSITDHNGFFFWGVTGAAVSLFVGIEDHAGAETVSNANSFHYEGGLKELRDGTLATKNKAYITSGTNAMQETIVWNENVSFKSTYATIIAGRVTDSVSSEPVMGVNVAVSGCGRATLTDEKGEYRIMVYTDGATTSRAGSLNFSNESVCCIQLTNNQRTFSLTGFGTTLTLSQIHTETDFSVAVTASSIVDYFRWKRGGRVQLGIVYYDAMGRSGFVNTSEELTLDIPWWATSFGNGYMNYASVINHIPPIWATHYQWLRTKDQIYQDYTQFAVEDVKYASGYDSVTDTPYFVGYGDQVKEIYLSLNSLVRYGENNAGSMLSYQYVEGDRVRLVRDHNGDYYPTLLDFEIKSQRGDFLILENNNASPEIQPGTWLEIYTPRGVSETKLFYEFGACFEIGDAGLSTRYHKAPILNQNPGVSGALGQFFEGNTYLRRRRMNGRDGLVWDGIVESPSRSDFFLSEDESIGRINTVNNDAKELQRDSSLRFSNAYAPDSNVNSLNQFEALNGISFPAAYGRVEKLIWALNVLLAVCNNETVAIYVNETVISDASGSDNLLAIGDKVLGYWRQLANKSGTYHAESVVESDGRVYWYDFKRSRVVRYGGNGIENISAFKMRKHFRDWSQYMDVSDNGSYAVAGFHKRYQEYMITFFFDNTLSPSTIVFSEEINRWTSEQPFAPNYYCRTDGERMLMFTGGVPHLHNEGLEYGNFFGDRQPQKITIISNTHSEQRKSYQAIQIHASLKDASLGTWHCPEIEVIESEIDAKQTSELAESDFAFVNNDWRSPFLRDINTVGVTNPLIEGDKLKGKFIKIQLENSNYNFLNTKFILIFSVEDKLGVPA